MADREGAVDFKQKLTFSMRKTEAWQVFAEALQRVNDETIEPLITRLKALPNLYEMHEDDVAIHFRELGELFTVGTTPVEDRPLLLQQRIDEYHFKGQLYPIKKTLQREFGNVSAVWQPLYAPIDTTEHPYTSILRKKYSAHYSSIDNWFLTSRARISVPHLDILKAYGTRFTPIDAVDNFANDLHRVIKPIIPTKIVFEGIALSIACAAPRYRAGAITATVRIKGQPYTPQLEPMESRLYQGGAIHTNIIIKGQPYVN